MVAEGRAGVAGDMGPTGGGTPGMPQIQATVRWESAKPVREAIKAALPADAEGFYLVSITGLPIGGRGPGEWRGTGSPDASDAKQARDEGDQRILEGTALVRRGKEALHPSKVGHPSGAGGSRTVFLFFPKDAGTIELADKDVTLITKIGSMELKVKFILKEMVYKGQLAL